MYSSIPNTKWNSNFWTLSFRCFVSWTARKLTNASVINSVTDICIFQVNITVFKDHFQDISRPWKILHLIPGLSILFKDLYEPWQCIYSVMVCWHTLCHRRHNSQPYLVPYFYHISFFNQKIFGHCTRRVGSHLKMWHALVISNHTMHYVRSGLQYHFPVTYWRDVWPSYWWAYDLVTCRRAALAGLPHGLWTRWTTAGQCYVSLSLKRTVRRDGHVQLMVDNG